MVAHLIATNYQCWGIAIKHYLCDCDQGLPAGIGLQRFVVKDFVYVIGGLHSNVC